MDDFTELLAFVNAEFFTIDQAVWIACDMPPPPDAASRPTQRFVIAEARIRAEVPMIEGGIEAEVSMVLLHGHDVLISREEAVRAVDLIAWFRANQAFGQLFLKAVAHTQYEMVGDNKKDRLTAWRQLCAEIPEISGWTDQRLLAELKKRHPTVFNVELQHFSKRILPNLRKP
jgi:hypothetical protein